MIQAGFAVKGAHVIVLGLTFKENCPDLRNSKVIDVIRELQTYGVTVHVHDPVAGPTRRSTNTASSCVAWEHCRGPSAIVAAVAHQRASSHVRSTEHAGQARARGRVRRRQVPAPTRRRCARAASTCGGCDAAGRIWPSALAEPRSRRWLVTGSAGFIGSHLLEALLRLGQRRVSLDNFATGHRANLDEVRRRSATAAWGRHRFIEGDIADPDACRPGLRRGGRRAAPGRARFGAALDRRPARDARAPTRPASSTCSSPRATPASSAFVYAASSSTYGDSPGAAQGRGRHRPAAVALCGDASTSNELYADVFGRCYGIATIGLRYFNVFGPRQDPERRLCGRDPALDRRDAARRAVRRSTATARPRATSASSPTPCRPTCSPRSSKTRRR